MYDFSKDDVSRGLELAVDLVEGLAQLHGFFEPSISWNSRGVQARVFFSLTPKDEAEDILMRLALGSDDPHEDAAAEEVEPRQAKGLAVVADVARRLIAATPGIDASEVAASMLDGRAVVAFTLPDGTLGSWTLSLDT